MEIPEIEVQNVGIPRIPAPGITNYVPHTEVYPFILHIGSPIVDIPGCVEYHPDSAKNRETPNLKEEDSQGTRVLCDGQYPSYDAMDYTPEDLLIQVDTPPPVVEPPPEIDPPEVPPTGDLGNKEIECPGPNNLRVGDLTQAGDEKVVGHEIQGTTCVTLYEPTTVAEKFLPSANQASTTLAIAVIATAGAAATPLLLRLIKPIIKKLTTTAQKKLGSHRELSKSEIMTNKYREKKGLPPLKDKKK